MHECGPLLRIDEWMLVSGGEEEKKKRSTLACKWNGGETATGDERGLMSKRAKSFLKSSFSRDVLFFLTNFIFHQIRGKEI